MAKPNEYKLANSWRFYIHLHNVDNWDYESYHKIIDLNYAEECILLLNDINFDFIRKTMMFVMRENVKPMWEDESNRNGGAFSFKVHNKNVEQVWKKLTYMLAGNSLTSKTYSDSIMGISLSPKKSFCIIKIWMNSCKYVNPNIFNDLDGLDKNGCLFKKHGSDN
jgi:hypothetical protein